MTLRRKHVLRAIGLVIAVLSGAQAHAIDGGARALSGDQLARATVAVGTIYPAARGARFSTCSGVLIGADLVMTAAHCVRGNPAAAVVFVYQGSEPILSPIGVASITPRAVSSGSIAQTDIAGVLQQLSLDVAVLRLVSPVSGRAPLLIAGNRSRLPSTLRLAGAGLSRRGSGRLRTATLKPLLVTETGLTIASVVRGQVCFGDSGGPVVVPGRRGPMLFGVASAVLTQQAPCGRIVAIAPAG